MPMEISIRNISEKMIARGFTSEVLTKGETSGWTNGLMDILEEEYNLESQVATEIHQIKKYGI